VELGRYAAYDKSDGTTKVPTATPNFEGKLLPFTSLQKRFYGALQQFTLSTNISSMGDVLADNKGDVDKYQIPNYVVASAEEDHDDNLSEMYVSSASSEEESVKLNKILSRVLGDDYQNSMKVLRSATEDDGDKYTVESGCPSDEIVSGE
jgi:hypothetical protein